MTQEQYRYFQDLQSLNDYMSSVSGDHRTNHILQAMCAVMSEDNLNEVIAAVCDKIDYHMGYDYWYGSRADYLDRGFMNEMGL